MLLSLPAPPPMQGCVLRSRAPNLYTSVSRRVPWSRTVRCCSDEASSSQSVVPPAPPQSAAGAPESLNPPLLVPLPSENARFGGGRDGGSFYGDAKFRSVGSRSEPSQPSIPGKFSKYSKPISRLHSEAKERIRVREERRDKKAFRKPMGDVAAKPDPNVQSESPPGLRGRFRSSSPPVDKIPEWMEKYKFSYSEVPSSPIIGFRQTPWSPFGPEDLLKRPWTGCAPLKESKKKRPEFDSFEPPPIGKKGVKFVARPGPFPPGQGPKPGKTREEVLGAPLTGQEIEEIVQAVNKRPKQLNLGRDGLTHNMLDVIHNHWKRSVCCKIKCKGVPTLDMDNVAQAVERETGGVIIRRAGGVMYVFRGRNYNFKDRPQIPIMLWKPPEPIYPRLIQIVPEGLTPEEARHLRTRGRRVAPLCKLAKNGVYLSLVADVRAQFRIDEVVRVDCEGMNATDYKKIGAKLRDLVPCTLLSFEKEQIIMCRKRQPLVESDQLIPEGESTTLGASVDSSDPTGTTGILATDMTVDSKEELAAELAVARNVNLGASENGEGAASVSDFTPQGTIPNREIYSDNPVPIAGLTVEDGTSASVTDFIVEEATSVTGDFVEEAELDTDVFLDEAASATDRILEDASVTDEYAEEGDAFIMDAMNSMSLTGQGDSEDDDVDALWQRAIDEGKALELENKVADPDVVYKQATKLSEVLSTADNQVETTKEIKEPVQLPPTSPFDTPPMGGLPLDELAKLLAP